MSTSKIIVLIIVTGVVGVGGWFIMKDKTSTPLQNSETGQQIESENTVATRSGEELSGTTSLRDLLRAESTKCTYEYMPPTGGTITGTVYFDNGKMRGDFDIEQGGTLYESHAIIEGETRLMYTWTETPMGMHALKMEIPDNETSNGQQTDETVSLDAQLDYKCSKWNVDASIFVPPTDIEFSDTNTLTPGANAGAGIKLPNGVGGQCGLCDQITDPTPQAECRAAFKCTE